MSDGDKLAENQLKKGFCTRQEDLSRPPEGPGRPGTVRSMAEYQQSFPESIQQSPGRFFWATGFGLELTQFTRLVGFVWKYIIIYKDIHIHLIPFTTVSVY